MKKNKAKMYIITKNLQLYTSLYFLNSKSHNIVMVIGNVSMTTDNISGTARTILEFSESIQQTRLKVIGLGIFSKIVV